MTPQSEESKKRMDAIFNSRKHLKYPPSTLDEIAEDEFKAGYKSGMQDPEANSERIKHLEGLLGECEELLQIAEKNLFFEGSDVYESRITSVIGKLKAAKEGGE